MSSPKSSSSLTDHISQVPPELLSEIFLLSVSGDFDYENTVRKPLLISQISKYWRDVALATPGLWSRLFLKISTYCSRSRMDITETWLIRSAAAPLRVHILWEEESNLLTHPVLDAIIQHSNRWHHVFLFIPISAFPSLNPIKGNLNLLTELSLGCSDFMGSEIYDMFEFAPRLRSFECINISPLRFNLPWTQIKTLPVASISLLECLVLQKRCPRLSFLNFILGFEFFVAALPFESVHLPHLHTASFITSPWSTFLDLNPLLEHCTYPQLDRLQLCDFKVTPAVQLPGFLSRSPLITSLDLRRVVLSDQDLLRCLLSTPNLIHLKIIEETEMNRSRILFSDFLLQEMTLSASRQEVGQSNNDLPPVLLPRLRYIDFSAPYIPMAPFIDMVESRIDPAAGLVPLHSVELELNDGTGFQDRVRQLRDKGLDIQTKRMASSAYSHYTL
ncbi:hypothetical protein VKT23_009212 [Stygiomarasmius scandens]|uniref:F-box domain-containing protein n=1 Tax=Marasmiellus scandens TaxID=2682957 RepID=A0ABR1JEP8_9AGAR